MFYALWTLNAHTRRSEDLVGLYATREAAQEQANGFDPRISYHIEQCSKILFTTLPHASEALVNSEPESVAAFDPNSNRKTAMPKQTKRAVNELKQVDNRVFTVGPLFPTISGWWVQANCGTSTSEYITYTADGPFEKLADAIQNAHEQAAELGWERNSYQVSVDQ